ncbi:MAG: (2Fe-2S)-binding protein [Archangiaceae bacterium]|nr:(2Fe-2S)-binding protein [Archangiaceae bacterium]
MTRTQAPANVALGARALGRVLCDAAVPRLASEGREISIELDGQTLPARQGEPVACSLIAAGEPLFARSVKYHRPRGPYCFAAACSSCLMRVDGVPNVFTCRTEATQGMRLERQNAFPSARLDVFAATDWFFPGGMNHHELLAGVPIAQDVMAVVARKLAGLGRLPDHEGPEREPAVVSRVEVAVVGGGVSGLAASQALLERGVEHLVLDRESFAGGRAAYGVPESEGETAPLPSPRLRLLHNVVGLFEDAGGRFLAVLAGERLHQLYVGKLLVAMGSHPALPAFGNNDLPGIYAARAVSRMIRRHQVLPGKRIACVGDATEAAALARLVTASGGEAVAVGAEPVAGHGLNAVSALTVRRGGSEEKVDCDAVALCVSGSPAFELARQGGARVVFDGARFVVEADADGRTAHPAVFVAGEQQGPCSLAESAARGRRAAMALSRGAP